MLHRSATLALFILAASHGNAVAQMGPGAAFERPTWFIGYVANAPHLLLGGTVAALPDRLGGWGLYLDAKRGIDSPASDPFFIPEISFDEARTIRQHRLSKNESHWRSFNVAVVRALQDDLILYLGGGAAEERAFGEFFDPDGDLGHFGHYFVEDEQAGGWQVNAMGGMYFRIMKHLAIQFGAESTPVGLTVGAIAVF